jgi:hypothetical protein
MNPFKLVRCLFGHHERSKARAKLIDQTYFSVCKHCGVRMRQTGNKTWVVDRAARPCSVTDGRVS